MSRQTLVMTVTVACLGVPWSEARADSGRGLSTNWSHAVTVVARSARGLEAGIPRSSPYGRALGLDIQGKYGQAYRAFQRAAREFGRMARSTTGDRQSRIRGWQLKAQQQQNISYNLDRQSYYRRRRYYNTYYRKHRYATYCHKKWLAIRAFGLDPPKKLLKEAIDAYQAALQRRPSYLLARISLAALYIDAGFVHKGRRQFSLAQPQLPRHANYSSYWLPLAYYYTVDGALPKAWRLLERYGRNSWRRREILRSNRFDRLRSDPRFIKVAGQP